MKRKTVHTPEPVIAADLLEMARKSVQADVSKRNTKCIVCGSETASTSSEQLCWVCRRLKISAWRDSDQQMTVQE